MSAEPAMFTPCNGAWGVRGWTYLILAAADKETATSALNMAWRNTATPKIRARAGEGGS